MKRIIAILFILASTTSNAIQINLQLHLSHRALAELKRITGQHEKVPSLFFARLDNDIESILGHPFSEKDSEVTDQQDNEPDHVFTVTLITDDYRYTRWLNSQERRKLDGRESKENDFIPAFTINIYCQHSLERLIHIGQLTFEYNSKFGFFNMRTVSCNNITSMDEMKELSFIAELFKPLEECHINGNIFCLKGGDACDHINPKELIIELSGRFEFLQKTNTAQATDQVY